MHNYITILVSDKILKEAVKFQTSVHFFARAKWSYIDMTLVTLLLCIYFDFFFEKKMLANFLSSTQIDPN
jgi:hypothetical protein